MLRFPRGRRKKGEVKVIYGKIWMPKVDFLVRKITLLE